MDPENLEVADWRKKESLGAVLLQLGVVGLVLSLAVLFAYQRGVDRQQATTAIEQARALVRADGPAELLAAVEILRPVLDSSVRGADAQAISARIYAELAVVHLEPGALERARVHLEAARLGASEVEERVSAEALLAVGTGRASEAIGLLEPRVQQGMRRLDLEYVLARAQLASGDRALALRTLSRAAEIASGEPRIHSLRGELLWEAGEAKEAVASFRRALAGNSRHPRARLGVALGLASLSGDRSGLAAVISSLRSEGVFSPGLASWVAAPSLALDVP